MREQRLGALAVRLPAEDAAAGRHADDDRTGEIAVGPIAQARGLRCDLVEGRVDIVGKLDLDAGPQSIRRHADRRADDTQFVDRRIEAARAAVFLLQAGSAAKHAAEIADILAEHDNAFVAPHGYVHRVADRLDHGFAGHQRSSKGAGVPSPLRGG